jgi:hypothetical protein
VISKETAAERIRVFTSGVVPGLLQTDDYARSQLRKGRPRDSEEEIAEKAAERVRRHDRVFGKEDPPFYRAVIDEAALTRPVGTHKIMADQLRRILTLRDSPRMRIQVLPFSAFDHGMQGGSLNLLDLEAGGTVALVESFRTGQGIESPREVVEYEELFEAVQLAALSAERSSEVIDRYMKGYEDAED